MVWYITHFADPAFGWVRYRVRFATINVVEKFSYLVSLWEHTRTSSKALGISLDATAEHALKGHVLDLVLELEKCRWDDDENAFAEIDILTSTFALFHGSA